MDVWRDQNQPKPKTENSHSSLLLAAFLHGWFSSVLFDFDLTSIESDLSPFIALVVSVVVPFKVVKRRCFLPSSFHIRCINHILISLRRISVSLHIGVVKHSLNNLKGISVSPYIGEYLRRIFVSLYVGVIKRIWNNLKRIIVGLYIGGSNRFKNRFISTVYCLPEFQ